MNAPEFQTPRASSTIVTNVLSRDLPQLYIIPEMENLISNDRESLSSNIMQRISEEALEREKHNFDSKKPQMNS